MRRLLPATVVTSTKMDAFGLHQPGQAHRAGLWLIKTELLETQTVDFSVGAEGLRHVPGDVIEIS
ncbi:phage tail protein [Escherichia coli]